MKVSIHSKFNTDSVVVEFCSLEEIQAPRAVEFYFEARDREGNILEDAFTVPRSEKLSSFLLNMAWIALYKELEEQGENS